MPTLGERLKTIRHRMDLTQQELANRLQTSRANYANWEINRAQPDPNTLIKIADFFGCSVDYLLGRTSIIFPPEDISKDFDVAYVEIIKEWEERGLTPEEIRKFWKEVGKIVSKIKNNP